MHSEFHNITLEIRTGMWTATFIFVRDACFMKCGFVLVHSLLVKLWWY